MIKLKIAVSNKTKNKYMALVYICESGREVVLTFDRATIYRSVNMTVAEIEELDVGYYDI